MRGFILFVLLLATAHPANADACLEKFRMLLAGNDETTPVKIHITQEIVGATTTQNWFYSDGAGNWMTEMIEPEAMQWTLFRDDRMYSSTDKGDSWAFVREMPSGDAKAVAQEHLAKHKESATDTLCGSEKVDGVSYETVSGKYVSAPLQGAEMAQKYWVDPDNGWIARSFTHSKTSAFEMKVTQVLEVQAEVNIPNPE